MEKEKQIGIYLDYSKARIMGFESDSITIVNAEFTDQEDDNDGRQSEKKIHNKQQQHLHEFYSKLEEHIRNYDHVLLFGPTDAKRELFNLLHEKPHLSKIKIHLQATDKLTENQQVSFVNDYFNTKKQVH